MSIQIIQDYYEKEDLVGLLDELQNTFTDIDVISEEFKSVMNGHACSETISKLTGHFMYLNTILGISEAELRRKEATVFNNTKIQLEKDGKKFIAGAVEKETTQTVSDYRRVRNIVEAYTVNCKTGISTCQSIMKSLAEESKV